MISRDLMGLTTLYSQVSALVDTPYIYGLTFWFCESLTTLQFHPVRLMFYVSNT